MESSDNLSQNIASIAIELAAINEKLRNLEKTASNTEERCERIEAHVALTNGRVSALENWRAWNDGHAVAEAGSQAEQRHQDNVRLSSRERTWIIITGLMSIPAAIAAAVAILFHGMG